LQAQVVAMVVLGVMVEVKAEVVVVGGEAGRVKN
jgi:hypothetical protein